VRTWAGWVYLATVIDCCTRMVVGYAMADHLRTSLVIDALAMARRNVDLVDGCIFHSDRGTQYTSTELAVYLENAKMRGSMGRRGQCWDNAMAEAASFRYRLPDTMGSPHRLHRPQPGGIRETTIPCPDSARQTAIGDQPAHLVAVDDQHITDVLFLHGVRGAATVSSTVNVTGRWVIRLRMLSLIRTTNRCCVRTPRTSPSLYIPATSSSYTIRSRRGWPARCETGARMSSGVPHRDRHRQPPLADRLELPSPLPGALNRRGLCVQPRRLRPAVDPARARQRDPAVDRPVLSQEPWALSGADIAPLLFVEVAWRQRLARWC
jgi:hypothetical protein